MKKSKRTTDYDAIRKAVLSGSYVVLKDTSGTLGLFKCPCCGRRIQSHALNHPVVVNQRREILAVTLVHIGEISEVGEVKGAGCKDTLKEYRVFGGSEADTYKMSAMGDKCYEKFYAQISKSSEPFYNKRSKFGRLFYFVDEVEKIRKDAEEQVRKRK